MTIQQFLSNIRCWKFNANRAPPTHQAVAETEASCELTASQRTNEKQSGADKRLEAEHSLNEKTAAAFIQTLQEEETRDSTSEQSTASGETDAVCEPLLSARHRVRTAFHSWSHGLRDTDDCESESDPNDLQCVAEAELSDPTSFEPRFALFLSRELEEHGLQELSSRCYVLFLQYFKRVRVCNSMKRRWVGGGGQMDKCLEDREWTIAERSTFRALGVKLEAVLALPGALPRQCLEEMLRFWNKEEPPEPLTLPVECGLVHICGVLDPGVSNFSERAHLAMFLADALCVYYRRHRLFDCDVIVGAASVEYRVDMPLSKMKTRYPLRDEQWKLLTCATNAVDQAPDALRALCNDAIWPTMQTGDCLNEEFFTKTFAAALIKPHTFALFLQAQKCYGNFKWEV